MKTLAIRPPKITVWVAISTKGVIGPYFFEIKRGYNVTFNSTEYVKYLREDFDANVTLIYRIQKLALDEHIYVSKVQKLVYDFILSLPWRA